MPKMPDIDIWASADADRDLKFHKTYPCMVSADNGKFYASLDPEEVDEMHEIARELFKDSTAGFEHHRGRLYISAASLEDLKKALYRYGRYKVEFTEERERVIIYKLDNQLHYVKHMPTGEIYANGSLSPNYGTESFWVDEKRGRASNQDYSNAYRLGIGAVVYDCVTRTTRVGVTTTSYERPSHPIQSAAEALNSFVKLDLIYRSSKPHRPVTGAVVVPYTDELATFMHGAMMELCRLADGLESLFATPENLALAAAHGGKLLPAPTDS